jgi:hypothetical protein
MIELTDAMKLLQARALMCGCQVLPDGGVLLWLGGWDDRQAETTLPPQSVGSAGSWLLEAARRIYPDQFDGKNAPGTAAELLSHGSL